jgi:hypothetical protein
VANLFTFERNLKDGKMAKLLREAAARIGQPEPAPPEMVGPEIPPYAEYAEPEHLTILRRIQTHMGIQEETP